MKKEEVEFTFSHGKVVFELQGAALKHYNLGHDIVATERGAPISTMAMGDAKWSPYYSFNCHSCKNKYGVYAMIGSYEMNGKLRKDYEHL